MENMVYYSHPLLLTSLGDGDSPHMIFDEHLGCTCWYLHHFQPGEKGERLQPLTGVDIVMA